MEYYTLTIVFLSVVLTTIYLSKVFSKCKQLPPGPKTWPIIGNIHELGDKPHRAVAELSKKYGPIMSLKLGSKNTIVISSTEVVKEMFLKHDLSISNRFIPFVGMANNHVKFSIVWLPVGPKWRELRKIATTQLFTTQKLDTSRAIRQIKVNELIYYVRQCAESDIAVDIGKVAFTTSLNLLSNTFFSMDLASHTSSYSQEFKEIFGKLLEMVGKPNLSDFFPLIKHLDLQGTLKGTKVLMNRILRIFEKIIDEGLKDYSTKSKDDVLA